MTKALFYFKHKTFMGLDYHAAKWLKSVATWTYATVLTIGRQNWWLSERESKALRTGFVPRYGPDTYSDGFWSAIGSDVESIDLVPDEHPTYLADLSRPRAIYNLGLSERFNRVVDFGTGEHVANQEEYWRNLHQSLCLGGLLVGMLPADGMCGHGLYQFSPEFFWRMGGFRPIHVGWVVYGPTVQFVKFQDNGRHQRKFRWPTYVAFCLEKVGDFELPVQYMNATTPTSKPRDARIAGFLLNIPGVRMMERIVTGLK